MNANLKINDRIECDILGTQVIGFVRDTGEHKGKPIISFQDTDGHGRFCYLNQLRKVNGVIVTSVTVITDPD